MKVNDSNLTPSNPAGAAKAQDTARAASAGRAGESGGKSGTAGGAGSGNDDVHLSELVRSLRSLAADSPERQAKIEDLTRTYASGRYTTDAEATASAMIDEAFKQ